MKRSFRLSARSLEQATVVLDGLVVFSVGRGDRSASVVRVGL
jgi:hypothetical protein